MFGNKIDGFAHIFTCSRFKHITVFFSVLLTCKLKRECFLCLYQNKINTLSDIRKKYPTIRKISFCGFDKSFTFLSSNSQNKNGEFRKANDRVGKNSIIYERTGKKTRKGLFCETYR